MLPEWSKKVYLLSTNQHNNVDYFRGLKNYSPYISIIFALYEIEKFTCEGV